MGIRRPNPIEHVEVTIRRADGITITYAAKQPENLNVTISCPDRPIVISADDATMPPVSITGLSVSFSANWRHGITAEQVPAP